MKYNDYEFEEQCKVIKWCKSHLSKCEALGMIVGSANGEERPKKKNKQGQWYCPSGNRLKAMGVLSGDPDLQVPIRIKKDGVEYSGLYIEMKEIEFPYSETGKPLKIQYGETSDNQKQRQNNLLAYGHLVVTCYSADTIDRHHGTEHVELLGAIDTLCEYLGIDRGMIEAGKRYTNWYNDWAVKMGVQVEERAYFHDKGLNDKLPF